MIQLNRPIGSKTPVQSLRFILMKKHNNVEALEEYVWYFASNQTSHSDLMADYSKNNPGQHLVVTFLGRLPRTFIQSAKNFFLSSK